MSGMSQYLAEFYGTNSTKTASAPEQDDENDLMKQAQVELFCKVAAEEKIDITSMPDAEVEQLFTKFVANTTKIAAEEEEEAKPDNKVEQATKELEEKKAEAAEFAKYDFFGRQMAHAYVDELKKIAADAKVAEFPPHKAEKDDEKDEKDDEKKKEHDGEKKAAGMPDALRRGLEAARGHAGGAAGAVKKHVGEAATAAKKHVGEAAAATKEHVGRHSKAYTAGAAGAGGVAAGAGAAHALHKKSSALDELALERAVVKVAEAGYDPAEAVERLSAALVLELVPESVKVAAAADVQGAVEIRALEMLEAARYPIDWAA